MNIDFVMGYALNLCKISIPFVQYNQNIRYSNEVNDIG